MIKAATESQQTVKMTVKQREKQTVKVTEKQTGKMTVKMTEKEGYPDGHPLKSTL